MPARALSRPAALLALAWAAALATLTLRKLHTFLHSDFDLAIFAQSARQVLRGSLFCSIRGMPWPGDHSSLVLLALAPFTALAPPAAVLVVAQVAALAAGAFPAYALARRRLASDGLAAGVALLWLAQPALAHLALFEFHPETLATAALLAAVEALDRGDAPATLAWTGWALLAKEDVAFVALGLAAWAALRRRPRLALGLAALAAASLALTFGWLKPRYGGGADYGLLYRDWGATPRAVIGRWLRAPLAAASALFVTPGSPGDTALKLRYWLELLGPLAFLPIAAPLALAPALPIVAEHLLSWRPQQHTIYYQYTALVLPFALAAATLGLARLPARARGWALAAALASAAAGQAAFGPLAAFGEREPAPARAWPDGADRALAPYRARALAALPARGDVAASFVFLARLAGRPRVETLLHVTSGLYTFSTRPYPMPRDLAGLVGDWSWDDQLAWSAPDLRARLARAVRVNDLRPVGAWGEIVTYARAARDTVPLLRVLGPPDRPLVHADSALAFAGGAVGRLLVPPGALLPLRLRWVRTARAESTYAVELALEDDAGDEAFEATHLVGYGPSPPALWPPGRMVEESLTVVVPLGVRPRAYTLVLRPVRLTDQSFVPLPRPGAPDGRIAIDRIAVVERLGPDRP